MPGEFSTGYSSGRIWINGASMNRTYFGTISGSNILHGKNALILNICNRNIGMAISSDDANFDFSNLLYFSGAEGLYQNSSGIENATFFVLNYFQDSSCLLTGFLFPNERACLICATGYYYLNQSCVSVCPSNFFKFEDTKSCQRKN